MPKIWAFVSNVSDFHYAVIARDYHGPCDFFYSTPSIETELCHPTRAFDKIEATFPGHEVYRSSYPRHVYFYDENGNAISQDKLMDL